MKQAKFTKKEFEKRFPNDDVCLEWVKNHLYPEGVYCPICKKITKYAKLHKRPVYACDICRHQISPLANTIFHKSPTPLKVWFEAIYDMATTRTGYSAKSLERKTGVTYKTAWRMFRQIRSLLSENTQLKGIVEIDEMYIGGKNHKPSTIGKTPIIGMVQRKGNVKTKVIKNTKWSTVTPLITENIKQRSIICSDEYIGFKGLSDKGYIHRKVNHSKKQWVNGYIHTNTIEGFWSLVKRGIDGVYHSVSPKYLQSYINEYAFRYNHRADETPMFVNMLNQIQH